MVVDLVIPRGDAYLTPHLRPIPYRVQNAGKYMITPVIGGITRLSFGGTKKQELTTGANIIIYL